MAMDFPKNLVIIINYNKEENCFICCICFYLRKEKRILYNTFVPDKISSILFS